MGSLFIIGNGFDSSHGLKTSYEDFHKYLKKQYPDAKDDIPTVPSNSIGHHGDIIYDDNAIVGFLMNLISNTEPKGEKWGDLENTLGVLDFGDCFDDTGVYGEDEDENPWDEVYNNEDRASDIEESVYRISKYFSDWINTIKIYPSLIVNSQFSKLIDKDHDYFLTFNYTKTLETLYHAKNVCHIHGEQGGELIFGHGNDHDNYEENMSRYIGAENALERIQVGLKKDTGKAINDHADFFRNLSSTLIDKIYSYGFSFSDVDMVYINEICRRIPTDNIIWYLNDYDDVNERDIFMQKIMNSGYRGSFNTFTVLIPLLII